MAAENIQTANISVPLRDSTLRGLSNFFDLLGELNLTLRDLSQPLSVLRKIRSIKRGLMGPWETKRRRRYSYTK